MIFYKNSMTIAMQFVVFTSINNFQRVQDFSMKYKNIMTESFHRVIIKIC